jgi:hypothetical protein
MTPTLAIAHLRTATVLSARSDAALRKAHRSFGRMIAANRRTSRRAFAAKLGVTGAMLALMECGKRRWPIARAELAVRLLTRREQWPD